MSKYTNALVNLSYVSGMATLIIGLVDRKMRFMDVSDIQWIILSVKGTNLLDRTQRESTSIIKDKTPLGARAVIFGMTGTF